MQHVARLRLARLWIGDKDAAEIMIGEGLAQPYDGRKKPSRHRPNV
jgi:endonuclease YncB( thermonuclease family)